MKGHIFKNYFTDFPLRRFAMALADLNNIKLIKVDKIEGKNINGINIKCGNILYINDKPDWNIIIHEMCHIMTVEPEYRHFMNDDTEESYKLINKLYPSNKHLRRESVTFGLQQLIYTKYKIETSVYGFYNGHIGFNANMDDSWIDKAKEIKYANYNDIKFDGIHVPKVYLSYEEPIMSKDILVLKHNDYNLIKAIYKNGYYFINGVITPSFDIFKWCYNYEYI